MEVLALWTNDEILHHLSILRTVFDFLIFSFSFLALDIPVARRLVYELTRSVLPRRLRVRPAAVVFSDSSVHTIETSTELSMLRRFGCAN
jgi:hypothetical protein